TAVATATCRPVPGPVRRSPRTVMISPVCLCGIACSTRSLHNTQPPTLPAGPPGTRPHILLPHQLRERAGVSRRERAHHALPYLGCLLLAELEHGLRAVHLHRKSTDAGKDAAEIVQ